MKRYKLITLVAVSLIANAGYGMDDELPEGLAPFAVPIPRRIDPARAVQLAAEQSLRDTIDSVSLKDFETPEEWQTHYSSCFRSLNKALLNITEPSQRRQNLYQEVFVAMAVLLENQAIHGAIGDLQTLNHINKALEFQGLFGTQIIGADTKQRHLERKWNYHLGCAISLYLQKLPELEEGEEDCKLKENQEIFQKAITLFKQAYGNRGYAASKTPLLSTVFLSDDEVSKTAQLTEARSLLKQVCTPKASPRNEDEIDVRSPKKAPTLKRKRSEDAIPFAMGNTFKSQAEKVLRDIEDALESEEDDLFEEDVADDALPPPPPPVDAYVSVQRKRRASKASPVAPSRLRIETDLSESEGFETSSSGRSASTSRKEVGNLKEALKKLGKTEEDLPALYQQYGKYEALGKALNIDSSYLSKVIKGMGKLKAKDLDPETHTVLTEVLKRKNSGKSTGSLRKIAERFNIKEVDVNRMYTSIHKKKKAAQSSQVLASDHDDDEDDDRSSQVLASDHDDDEDDDY